MYGYLLIVDIYTARDRVHSLYRQLLQATLLLKEDPVFHVQQDKTVSHIDLSMVMLLSQQTLGQRCINGGQTYETLAHLPRTPEDKKRCPNVVSMLAHCLRRWASIETTLSNASCLLGRFVRPSHASSAVQRQTAVTASLKHKQLLLFIFTRHSELCE